MAPKRRIPKSASTSTGSPEVPAESDTEDLRPFGRDSASVKDESTGTPLDFVHFVPASVRSGTYIKKGRPTTRSSTAVRSGTCIKRGRPTTRARSGKRSVDKNARTPEQVASFNQWWDDTFPESAERENEKWTCTIPDRKESIDYHYKKKNEFQQKSAILLKQILDMPQVTTYQETMQQIIDRRLTDSAVIEAVCEYVERRLCRSSYLLGMLQGNVWDEEILQMIIVCIEEELEEIGLEIPELKNILELANETLKQRENNVVFSFMAKSLKDVVHAWDMNSIRADQMMKLWAKNPTPTFETAKLKLKPPKLV